MIRKTLPRTKQATWAVYAISARHQNFPVPIGTCFMIDPTGYILTADHVVSGANGVIPSLHRPPPGIAAPPEMLEEIRIVERFSDVDLALLKVDFDRNSNKAWLKGRTDFPYLQVAFDVVGDGTPVYSYGFPLPLETQIVAAPGMTVGMGGLRPRTTSAIIASATEVFGRVQHTGQPRFYVTDKAFNYGNSGGPLILQETGSCAGVVVRLQPVSIPQPKPAGAVTVPSLYGVCSSVANIETPVRRTVPHYHP